MAVAAEREWRTSPWRPLPALLLLRATWLRLCGHARKQPLRQLQRHQQHQPQLQQRGCCCCDAAAWLLSEQAEGATTSKARGEKALSQKRRANFSSIHDHTKRATKLATLANDRQISCQCVCDVGMAYGRLLVEPGLSVCGPDICCPFFPLRSRPAMAIRIPSPVSPPAACCHSSTATLPSVRTAVVVRALVRASS